MCRLRCSYAVDTPRGLEVSRSESACVDPMSRPPTIGRTVELLTVAAVKRNTAMIASPNRGYKTVSGMRSASAMVNLRADGSASRCLRDIFFSRCSV